MQLPTQIRPCSIGPAGAETGKRVRSVRDTEASESCPDRSVAPRTVERRPRPCLTSQFVMLPVPIMLNQPSNPKLTSVTAASIGHFRDSSVTYLHGMTLN
jgi:hypothetical protein